MILVLVDGSNVARCAAWQERHPGADDQTLRRRLVDAVTSWAAGHGSRAVITFDGAGPWRAGSVAASELVEVVGTGRDEGDDVIARRAIAAVRASHAYWLVTSDRELQVLAGGGADRVVSADAFVVELEPAEAAGPGGSVAPAQANTRIAESVPEDVRVRLERMRRGES